MAVGDLSFAFNPAIGETPEKLKRKRMLADAILGETSHAPRDVGEGLNAVGQALLYRKLMGGVDKAETEGASGAAKVFNSLFGNQFPDAPASKTGAAPSAFSAASPDTAAPATANSAPPSDIAAPSGNNAEWLNSFYKQARDSGMGDVQARLMATQAALESGFGKHAPGNNYFGIKAGKSWNGPVNELMTTEQNPDGSSYRTRAAFRKYGSVADALADRNAFMQRAYPDAANAGDWDTAMAGLHHGKFGAYATDLNYAKKLAAYNAMITGGDTPMVADAGNGIPAAAFAPQAPIADAKQAIQAEISGNVPQPPSIVPTPRPVADAAPDNPLAATMANLPLAAERLPTASKLPPETNAVGDMLPSPFALGAGGNPIPRGGLPYVPTPEQAPIAQGGASGVAGAMAGSMMPPGSTASLAGPFGTPEEQFLALANATPPGPVAQGAMSGGVGAPPDNAPSGNVALSPQQRVASVMATPPAPTSLAAQGNGAGGTGAGGNAAAQRIMAAMMAQQPQPEPVASVPAPLPGKTVADMPVAGNTQAQQDAVDLNALPVEAGGLGGAIQPGTEQGPSLQQLMEATGNPWVMEKYGPVVTAMLKQKMDAMDPATKLDTEYKMAQIAALKAKNGDDFKVVGDRLMKIGADGTVSDATPGEQAAGAGKFRFEGKSVEAQALNGLMDSGQITEDQAQQLGAGKTITGPNGEIIFLTPQGIFAQPAQGGPASPVTPPAATPPVPASQPAPSAINPPTAAPAASVPSADRPGQIKLTDGKGNKPTELQARNGAIGKILLNEVPTLGKTFKALADPTGQFLNAIPGGLGNAWQSEEYQRAAAAVKTSISNVLYSLSGASSNPGEVVKQIEVLTPAFGDKPGAIADKLNRFKTYVRAIASESNDPELIKSVEDALAGMDADKKPPTVIDGYSIQEIP